MVYLPIYYIVVFPAVTVSLMTITPRSAMAEVADAEQAVRILSRAQSADARCRYLSSRDRVDLDRVVARAELAATSQMSRDAARAASRDGRAAGRKLSCSPSGKADVKETLDAARIAIAAADGVRPSAKKVSQRAQDPADAGTATTPKAANVLGRYANVVTSYYVERKCKHLGRGDAGRFWRQITKFHKLAVAQSGPARVAKVMETAERQARRTVIPPILEGVWK